MSKNQTVQVQETVAPVAAPAPDISKVDLTTCTTTSSKIRALNSAGFSTGAIAKFLDKRYQHVRNVLVTPVTTPKA